MSRGGEKKDTDASGNPGSETGTDSGAELLDTGNAGIDAPPSPDAGTEGNAGTGTGEAPKRGRGRPKREQQTEAGPAGVVSTVLRPVEQAFPAKAAEPKAERTRSKKKEARAELAANLDVMLQTVFGGIAMMRGKHWNLDPKERANLTGPLAEIIDSMSDNAAGKVAERVQKIAAPAALVIAAAGIVGSRAAIDVQLAAIEKANRPNTQKGLTPNARNVQPTQQQAAGNGPSAGNGSGTPGGTVAPAHAGFGVDPYQSA